MPEKKFRIENLKDFMSSVFQMAKYILRCLKTNSSTEANKKLKNPWHNDDGSFNAKNPVGEKLVLVVLNYIASLKIIPKEYDPDEDDFIAFDHHLAVMQLLSEPTQAIEAAYFRFYAPFCNYIFSEEFINFIIEESSYKNFKLSHLEAVSLVYSIFKTNFPGSPIVDIYAKQKILGLSKEEYYQLFPEDASEI